MLYNPYYTNDGVSRGFSIYDRTSNTQSTVLSKYKSYTQGGGVHFGVPISEDDGISFGLSTKLPNWHSTGAVVNGPLITLIHSVIPLITCHLRWAGVMIAGIVRFTRGRGQYRAWVLNWPCVIVGYAGVL
ncbi:MAG: BamA/TamA family outer membrane protein [Nitrosomonadales bacterium]